MPYDQNQVGTMPVPTMKHNAIYTFYSSIMISEYCE